MECRKPYAKAGNWASRFLVIMLSVMLVFTMMPLNGLERAHAETKANAAAEEPAANTDVTEPATEDGSEPATKDNLTAPDDEDDGDAEPVTKPGNEEYGAASPKSNQQRGLGAKSLSTGVATEVTFSCGDESFIQYFGDGDTVDLSDICSGLGLTADETWFLSSYAVFVDPATDDEIGPGFFDVSNGIQGDKTISLKCDSFTEEFALKICNRYQQIVYIKVTNGGTLGVSSWDGLQSAIDMAPDNTPRTIVLREDILNDDIPEKTAIIIPNKKQITLDLNGKVLDGGWFDYDPRGHRNAYAGENRHVLKVNGGAELTVTDSGEDTYLDEDQNSYDAGSIRGGCADKGGGIYVSSGAKCTIEGGTIRDNGARIRGAGIYTEGTLVMTGGAIIDNFGFDDKEKNAVEGGGIYCDENGTVNLKDVIIRNNIAFDGCGLEIHQNIGQALIDSCTIEGNTGSNPSVYSLGDVDVVGGGGIYFKGSSLKVKDTVISANSTEGDGGGIYVKTGTVTVQGGKVTDNKANDEGKNGGGIYNKAATVLNGCNITGNSTDRKGGGVFNEPNANLLLCGSTIITENTAAFGGGVHAEAGSGKILLGHVDEMLGASPVKVEDNMGGNMYLDGGAKLTLVSAGLTKEAYLGISMTDPGTGIFTTGFTEIMGEDADPDTYFFSDAGYLVVKKDNEGCLMMDLDEDHKFLKRNERVNTNVKGLGSSNWMSGLSGERYLNEINMPGTHDSSMYNVSSKGCLSGDIGKAQATTQKEYIFEQLEHGARFFDIRMKTYYCSGEKSVGLLGGATALGLFNTVLLGSLAVPLLIASGIAAYNDSSLPIYKDDGKNLWACHGRSAAGTFYALDENNKTLSVAKELEWMKDFLKKHPTETIIIDARAETDKTGGEEYYKVMERFNGVMEELSAEKNPSTGESYVYWEDGKVGKKFTHWPQLKDCRGKIVLWGKLEITADTIGGIWMDSDGIQTQKPAGTYKDGAARGDNLKDFIETHNTLQIPRNAMDGQMKEFYWLEMNTTDTSFMQTPTELAVKYVLPVVFGSGDLVNETKKGTYFGWFGIDAAKETHLHDVWITNFPDDLDYCTITVKCGFSGEGAPADQTYKVLRGSTITIPGCIYDSNQADLFAGWKASTDNKTYIKNNKYKVKKDVTFTAQWSDQIQTPVNVVWKDADDLEGKRPETLKIRYNEDYPEIVKADEGWAVMLSGELTDDPAVDDNDVLENYTAKVEGQQGKDGYTITMTHTPDVKVNASGTVTWEDENDKDGIRPDSVTLHLYANGEEVEEGTATAGNGWTFDLGDDHPRYQDGELVAYKLVEDEIEVDEELYGSGYINGVKAIEGNIEDNKNAITGFEVTNTHEVKEAVIYARIEWDDDNDMAGERPESVTVQWLKDGEAYGEPIVVKPEEESDWTVGLKLTYAEMQKIAEEQDAIAEKYEAGDMSEEEFVEAIKGTVTYSIEQNEVDNYATTVTIENPEGTDDEKVASYFRILNTYKKHEHGLTKTDAKKATCTTDGNSAYWTCDQGDEPCGKYYSEAEGTKKIEEGSWIIPATGHDWGEWTQTKAPTCSAKGEKERICKNDASHKDTGEVAIDPDAHNWGEWTVTKEATETEEGSETRTCKNDPSHTETRAIPVLGHAHKLTRTTAVPATCTKDGNIEYWICDKGDNPCGRYFSDEEATTEIEEGSWIIPATGHDWGEWTQTKAPTCSAKGEKERICKNDASHKDTGEVAIDPDAHNWGEWVVTKEATETKEGSETRTCMNDSSHTETRAIPVLGHAHKLTRTAAVPATCTKDGNIEYWICDKGDNPCGRYFADSEGKKEINKEDTIVKAIGHKWGEWKVTKKPTATTDGEKQRVCKNDSSHVEKQKVPATGVSGTLFAKMTTKGKSNLTISWSKVDGAAGFDIFFAKCNKGNKVFTCKNIKTIKGNKTLSWTKKGLKKKTAYKAYVKAYVMKDGKKTYVKTSPMVHAYTSGGTKKFTNAKKVTVKKAAVSLKVGKTYKIKASVKKLKKNKKLMPEGHAPKLRYLSSNTKIATVSSSGKIKAKAKGKCYIYVYAHNGVSKKVKVTVK